MVPHPAPAETPKPCALEREGGIERCIFYSCIELLLFADNLDKRATVSANTLTCLKLACDLVRSLNLF